MARRSGRALLALLALTGLAALACAEEGTAAASTHPAETLGLRAGRKEGLVADAPPQGVAGGSPPLAFAPSPANTVGQLKAVIAGIFGGIWRALASIFRPAAKAAGYYALKNPTLTQSISTSPAERERLGLRGLLPAGVVPMSAQLDNLMQELRAKSSDLERYNYLATVQDGNEDLYFAALVNHTVECMPIVYTPTVGQACMSWNKIYRHTPRGVYVSLEDAGRVRSLLKNWPQKDVKTIVLTDGERILGLGDLGVNGMGIPIGKLALYTACAGINPAQCLPVHIDTGTNNKVLLEDPTYMGLRRERERGPAYDALLKEFVEAAQAEYGRAVLLQFEDFGNLNAFRLMREYQSKACTFNDDIQGTASVIVAGLLASERITQTPLYKHKFLFYGAGEAGVGIADLIAEAVAEEQGTSVEEARKQIWLMDSKGLVSSARTDKLAEHKLHYAHEHETGCQTLEECIDLLKPTALLGVAAQGQTFTEAVVRKMASNNEEPIVFALSNPTSKAECTAEQAYTWSDGRAIFASGSPMEGVEVNGKKLVPGQGNNAYIFPGLGLAAIAAGAKTIDDKCFLVAAKSLAMQVSEERLAQGTLYPDLKNIREVSAQIAVDVAEYMYETGKALKSPKPTDMLAYVKSLMYHPEKNHKTQ
eukprot:CAMPEP_0206232478 /NCGR_PEP_ID=MMETSP0047_2-20121206/11437_1 /ASSEMBLY_ACC=CAM_ASM_000192 /TAXON_ID=195065 /ORGANISM="Chroomonas mesostigmatica_cf, Strain CCMP1168" /LENGTH=647 /DNA_ID=CAMNT_0053656217 /DNA_START=11 /DNA_END=1954 /DNA_ORIENTATION=+